MDILIQWLQSGLSAIVPFVILLGLLIFVHEMGHFLVAKFYKVKVEVFSLGFGKKIFQFKRGDTVYCLSLIPLGGYVKMYGDDPTASIDEEDKKVAFLHKPVGQRIAIVLAGPLMNFFFAILIFAIIAFSGETQLSPQLGDIKKNSQAYQDGFRSGDLITSVADQKVKTWKTVSSIIQNHAGQVLKIQVRRNSQIYTLSTTPKLEDNPNILSPNEKVGLVNGLSTRSRSSMTAVYSSQSQAYLAGLRTGDIIKKINGEKIQYWRQLKEAFDKSTSPVKIEFERLDFEKKSTTSLSAQIEKTPKNSTFSSLGFDNPDLYLQKVVPDSPAQKAGLRTGDRILMINGKKISQWEDVISAVSSFDEKQKSINISINRSRKTLNFSIVPKITRQLNRQGLEENRYTIGIVPFILPAIPSIIVIKEPNPIKALWKGTERTWTVTVMTALSFVRLFQAKISPKNIGGVISIGQAASETFKIGWIQFLQMMAVISVNLFIINLLPVPVLDGGHLMFFGIEAIRGAPLSLKKMEMAQQIGIIVLMSLMAFALFNDFSRLFNFNW